METRRTMIIFYAVVALPLGLLGLFGSVVWYLRNRQTGGELVGGPSNLGAAILAVASLIMIIWGIVVLLAYKRISKEESEEL